MAHTPLESPPVHSPQTDQERIFQALTPRQRQVLRIIIEQYVQHAHPVGSKAIVRDFQLGVSSATIRNDMARLERLGLIAKAHISSGRIPTHLGYRLYVGQFVGDHHLSPSRQNRIQYQFRSMLEDSQYWLQDATLLLSTVSRSLALASELQYVSHRFKHLELISVTPGQALMVVVMTEGQVHQRMLAVSPTTEQEDLTRISQELNRAFERSDRSTLQEKLPELTEEAREIAEMLLEMMPAPEADGHPPIVRRGLMHIMEAPEFADSQRVRKVVEVFDSTPRINDMLVYAMDPGEVQVVIAGEGKKELEDLGDISLVLSSYGVSNRATGLVGVVGPVRMAYRYNIGAVRLFAALMSGFVQDTIRETDAALPETVGPT